MAEPTDEYCPYSPSRIDGWLSRWAELRELAYPSAPAVRYDARLFQPTPGRKLGDCTRYVDIMADIERAWAALTIWSIEWNTVKTLMDGYPLRQMAMTYRLHADTVYDAYHRATKRMAERLGWRE